MQQERAQLHEETQRLREEIQLLNSAIKWDLNLCFISNCIRTVKQLKAFIYGREGPEITFFSVVVFFHLSLLAVRANCSFQPPVFPSPGSALTTWGRSSGSTFEPRPCRTGSSGSYPNRHQSDWSKYNHPSFALFFQTSAVCFNTHLSQYDHTSGLCKTGQHLVFLLSFFSINPEDINNLHFCRDLCTWKKWIHIKPQYIQHSEKAH